MCAIWRMGGGPRGRALTWARTRFSRQAPGETLEGALDPCASERRKAEPTAVGKHAPHPQRYRATSMGLWGRRTPLRTRRRSLGHSFREWDGELTEHGDGRGLLVEPALCVR